MAAVIQEKPAKSRPKVDARAAMESLNQEAGKFNIWLRTQANAPAQRPWFRDTGIETAQRIVLVTCSRPPNPGLVSRNCWRSANSIGETSDVRAISAMRSR